MHILQPMFVVLLASWWLQPSLPIMAMPRLSSSAVTSSVLLRRGDFVRGYSPPRLRGGEGSTSEDNEWEVPRHAWDQSRNVVKVYIFLSGIGTAWGGHWRDHVDVVFGERAVEAKVRGMPGSGGGEQSYRLNLQLFSTIDVTKCTYTVRGDRISLALPKVVQGGLWPKLTKVGRLTLDDIPTLPDSFRADPEPPRAVRQNQEEWTAQNSSSKMEVLASERQALEGVLAAARDGDTKALKERVEVECLEREVPPADIFNNFKDANGRGAAHLAAANGHSAVIHYLRDAGAHLGMWDAAGHTPLYAAAAAGRHEVVRMLSALDGMPVDTKDASSGASALCHAAANGDVAMIDLLVAFGASVDANSELGTPVQWAAMADSERAVYSLLSHGANPDIAAPACAGRSLPGPLIVAASMNQTEICLLFLKHGADATAKDAEGVSALHHAAANGNAVLFRALLSGGANPFAHDGQGSAPATSGTGKWFKGQLEVIMREWARTDERGDAYWDAVANSTDAQDQLEFLENTSMLTLEEKNEILSMPTARPEYLTAKAKRQLGNELLASGDVQGAIQMYTTAIDMCPGVKESLANRASALLRLARQGTGSGDDGKLLLERALRDAQEARELDPSWAKGHYREGQVYKEMGNLPEAGLCFWEALKLDPHSTEAKDAFRKCVDEGRRKAGLQEKGFLPEEEAREEELKEWGRERAANAVHRDSAIESAAA